MSYRVYPVQKTEDQCDDYEVYVNGNKAELNTARVSAYPFNRRWPGHQRQTEQTELVNFLSMESDEETELKIIPKTPSFGVRIRPRGLAVNARTDSDGAITLRVNGAAQFSVEPYGRNHALFVFIDNVKTYDADKNDCNVLYYGKGVHDVGNIYLKSGQTLFIDDGAVVYATVFAFHADNIKILGRGILDNGKNKEIILYSANENNNLSAVANAKRQNAINFVCCKNVEVDGITIRDSLLYNVETVSCENVRIDNIKIIGCWRYNSDGVHFSNCINATLLNSFLRTFDDSICVRGFANYEYTRFLNDEKEEDLSFICRDVVVDNCVVWNDWGKNLQIGTETFAREITNVRFRNCKLIHTTGQAITIWLVDNAKIHNVEFSNIDVEYDDYMMKCGYQSSDSEKYTDIYNPDYGGNLIYFAVSKHFEYSLIKTEEELGEIDGVKISDVRLYSVQKPDFAFFGDNPNSRCKNVELKGIYWNGELISQELFKKQTEKNDFAANIVLIND